MINYLKVRLRLTAMIDLGYTEAILVRTFILQYKFTPITFFPILTMTQT